MLCFLCKYTRSDLTCSCSFEFKQLFWFCHVRGKKKDRKQLGFLGCWAHSELWSHGGYGGTVTLHHIQTGTLPSAWDLEKFLKNPFLYGICHGPITSWFSLSRSWCWKGTLFFLRSRKPQRVKSSPLPGLTSQLPAHSVPAAPIPVAGLGSGRKAKVHLTHDWEQPWLFCFA